MYHVSISCPVAKRLWDEVKKPTGVRIPELHPCSWATDVLNRGFCSKSMAALIICGAWALWSGWNARRHGQKVWEPGATARYISSLLEELSTLMAPSQLMKPSRQKQWQCPEEGWIKVNTDAAFSANTCTGRAVSVITWGRCRRRLHDGLTMSLTL